MKGSILLLPLFQLVCSLPHLKFTPEEYEALEFALDGRKPLFITSALPLYAHKNVHSHDHFVLGIGEREYYKKGPFADHSSFIPRKYFEANKPVSFSKQIGHFNPVDMEQLLFSRNINEILMTPLFRHQLGNLKPITTRRILTRLREKNIPRAKRQVNYVDSSSEGTTTTEEPVVYADELGFGLSTAGGVLGGAVGGYLDTTGTATIKLIKSLENLGLLAVGQLDTFLDQQEERQKEKQEQKDEQTSSYEVQRI